MNFLKYIKRGKAREQKPLPKPLRIEGVKTVMTPEPDDAELAAQALLESLYSPQCGQPSTGDGDRKKGGEEVRDAAYYRSLADRIRAAHEAEARAALRYVSYCEQELKTADAQKLAELERGLYRYLDTVEREKGGLKARWQHALAEVIVGQMNTT